MLDLAVYAGGLVLTSLAAGRISPHLLFICCCNGLLVFSVSSGDASFSLICCSCTFGGISPLAFCSLREILVGKSCGKFFRENLAGNAAGHAVGNLVGNLVEKVLMVCNRSKNGKKSPTIFGTCGNFLSPLQPLKPY